MEHKTLMKIYEKYILWCVYISMCSQICVYGLKISDQSDRFVGVHVMNLCKIFMLVSLGDTEFACTYQNIICIHK